MASLQGRVAAALCAIAALAWSFAAPADVPFYANKRLTILINFAAGGPTDIEGRLFAKYLGRHLDGAPNVLVQNMDGAGGIVGAKYLARWRRMTAPWSAISPAPDSCTRSIRRASAPISRLTISSPSRAAPRSTTCAPMCARPEGGRRHHQAKGLIGGGLSVDTPKDLRMRLGLDLLGVPYKYVTGYRSSPPARLAFQKAEINMFSESPPSYRSVVMPDLVATGQAIAVWYDAYYDGGAFATPAQMAGLPILPFHELYRKIDGKLPSGRLWNVYRAITASDGTMQRVIAFPPGTPEAASRALAAAIVAVNADKDYAAEAIGTIGFVPEWTPDRTSSARCKPPCRSPPRCEISWPTI